MTSPPDDTTTDTSAIIAALRIERDAALAREAKLDSDYAERAAHQGATVEVLQAMAASPGEPEPVFEVIVRRARDLCDAYSASLARVVDGSIVLRAYCVPNEAEAKGHEASFPRPVAADTMFGRAILAREPVQLPDVAADQAYALREGTLRGAVRAQAAVPLMRDGEAIGAINMTRRQTGEFSQAQIELLQVFANQAVIAINSAETYRALRERTAALATRNSEYGERIEHQAATIDVLKVMSASPGDPQPAFELIVRRARELCNSAGAGIAEYDGVLVHQRSLYGDSSGFSAEYIASFPMRPTRGSIPCRAILDKRIIHIRNMDIEPELLPIVRHLGVRSVLSIPLLRDGAVIGAFTIHANQSGGFSDSQIELLKTFAEQAVIAITSAETYRALQTRTSDLQETLEYQTATSDVLNVISRSTFDLQPVLSTVAETAARLCVADQAALVRHEGGTLSLAANWGFPPEYEARMNEIGPLRVGADAQTVSHRAIIERRVIHIPDVAAVPGYPDPPIRLGRQRTSLGVPLLREGEPVGLILLARQRVEPFTDRQIELVRTFADQAVIAIENTRLVTEQREALEQQTATAEVLQVINANPGNLAPVFDAVLEKSLRLCEAEIGVLHTYDGDLLRLVATRGVPPALVDYLMEPHRPPPGGNAHRIVRGENIVHLYDVKDSDAYRSGDEARRAHVDLGGGRTAVYVALRKDNTLLGVIVIYRQEVRPFTDKQIALLESFAAQAVIAMENARLITEQREALEQQTATAEVLQVINANTGNLAPVFDAILDKAHTLCGAVIGSLVLFDGTHFRAVATHGFPDQVASLLRHPVPPYSNTQELIDGVRFRQIEDIRAIWINPDALIMRAFVEYTDVRTALFVPLRKDGALLGFISAFRPEVRAFSDKEIALLENFAAQAVIAMENARLLTEQREALEQQTATAEVLGVINASPGNLAPVFDAILDKALHLCEAPLGGLAIYDGETFYNVAKRGAASAYADVLYAPIRPGFALDRLVRGEEFVQVADITADDLSDSPRRRAFAEIGARTAIWIALRRDKAVVGMIDIYRKEVRPFTGKQIALLQNFAAQAVIAMDNARLLDEIRQRQEELRVTFENMGDGVAMFDETQHLVAWNRKFQDILDVPDDIIARRQTFSEYVRYLAERGEYDPEADPEEHVRRLIEQAGQSRTYERTRPDGRVIEIRHNPVPGGGFVLIYADITERKRNEAEIRAARDAAEEASRAIEAAYRELKTAQANLIQVEKMASLGQLTAGIAHEIKNPLNFVNNFSALSTELIDELRDVLAPEPLGETARTEVDDLTALLKGNLEKVVQHGQRADGIVRSMLDHSRGSSGERRVVDLNALIDEALNLAYHGARAQDQSFNITLERDFGEGIAPIEVNPQDITRVFLNIFSNGFYATTRRARDAADARFEPTLKVATRDADGAVEIHVRDNGTGIPADIRDKLFQPFFTTKPTGEGTGLGLSITYDIVTQQHAGSIAVESKVGEYSEFTIRLPRNP